MAKGGGLIAEHGVLGRGEMDTKLKGLYGGVEIIGLAAFSAILFRRGSVHAPRTSYQLHYSALSFAKPRKLIFYVDALVLYI